MIKLEIRKSNRYKGHQYCVINNLGEQNDTTWLDSTKSIRIDEVEFWNNIKTYNASDFQKKCNDINFQYNTDSISFFQIGFNIVFKDHIDKSSSFLTMELMPDSGEWANPFSVTQFSETFREEILGTGVRHIEYFPNDDDSPLNGFGIKVLEFDITLSIEELHQKSEALLEKIYLSAKEKIVSKSLENTISILFSFPESTKTYCCKYLMYFGKFLENFNIKVNTSLKENINEVLFNIQPIDSNQALDRILEALEIYLEVPKYEISTLELIQKKYEIGISEWEANIYHLKSELLLAKSILQTKEATIEALQSSNYNYKQIIIRGGFDLQTKKNEEEVAGGLLKIKEFEGKGVSINLPEIYRRLKKLFLKE